MTINKNDPVPIQQRDRKWFVLENKLVGSKNEPYWRILSKKPKLTPLTRYKDPLTGDKLRLILVPEPHGDCCHECKKWYIPPELWEQLLQKYTKDPEKGYVNSKGEVVCIGLNPIKTADNKDWIVTRERFSYRDYCSDECYNSARKRKRQERREKERQKKYKCLPAVDRPDGRCKICQKNISDRRVGALTCGPAHRQEYNRKKK